MTQQTNQPSGKTTTAETSGSEPVQGQQLSARTSDRIFGLVCLVLAIWYSIEARTFDGTAFSSGPVGPKTLPTATGILFGAFAIYLIVKPDTSPDWPSVRTGWRPALAIACSYFYGQMIKPVGFIVSSVVMALLIGSFFNGPMKKLLPLSIAFVVALAFIFNNVLGLKLPAGWWGGF